MDFGADYDSGTNLQKKSTYALFSDFLVFWLFSKFLLFRTILAYFGVHVEALKNIDWHLKRKNRTSLARAASSSICWISVKTLAAYIGVQMDANQET